MEFQFQLHRLAVTSLLFRVTAAFAVTVWTVNATMPLAARTAPAAIARRLRFMGIPQVPGRKGEGTAVRYDEDARLFQIRQQVSERSCKGCVTSVNTYCSEHMEDLAKIGI